MERRVSDEIHRQGLKYMSGREHGRRHEQGSGKIATEIPHGAT
jgi:hypothetical protein